MNELKTLKYRFYTEIFCLFFILAFYALALWFNINIVFLYYYLLIWTTLSFHWIFLAKEKYDEKIYWMNYIRNLYKEGKVELTEYNLLDLEKGNFFVNQEGKKIHFFFPKKDN